jgi:hypothetical protein
MNIANLSTADLVGTLLGFLLTLLIFSYIFGDNALFRLGIHIFIGVAAGYTAVVAWYNIIWPQLFRPLFVGNTSERLFVIVPLVLSGLLLAKVSPRLALLGNPVMAYLVGVGVATAIGGAVLGTIFPQVGASINLFDLQIEQADTADILAQLANASIILVGTISTLAFFHFGLRTRPDLESQRGAMVEGLGWAGEIFIAVTFGALFAGVYTASLTAFVERLRFLTDFVLTLVLP